MPTAEHIPWATQSYDHQIKIQCGQKCFNHEGTRHLKTFGRCFHCRPETKKRVRPRGNGEKGAQAEENGGEQGEGEEGGGEGEGMEREKCVEKTQESIQTAALK